MRAIGKPATVDASACPLHEEGGGRPCGEPDLRLLHGEQGMVLRERALLRCLIDSIPDLIFVKDENGVYIGCNRAFEARTGHRESEVVGRTDLDFFPADEAAFYRAKDREMLADGRPMRIEEVVQQPDGTRRHYDTLKTPFFGPRGEVLGLVGIARDVTDRRRAEEDARLAATVFNGTSEAIVVTDARNRIVAVNPAFTRITGYALDEVRGHDPKILSSGRHDEAFYREMWRGLQERGGWEGEIWNRRKDGQVFPEWLSITAVTEADGRVVQYVAVFVDITRRKAREELIWHQANFDALTELPNRNLFHERLDRALVEARRGGHRVGLLFLDLDRFKWVNDSLGHSAGDQLLKIAAERIRGCVREEDTVSRLGGDEFTVVLRTIRDAEDCQQVAGKILEVLARPYRLGGQEAFATASVGVTVCPDDGQDIEALLRNADTAMYAAKEGGRNGVRFFQPDMNARAVERVRMERSLRAALDNDELLLHYHPILDLATGRPVGVEALLRWRHPERGLVPPGNFIPLAEETGLINPIGEWVLVRAVQQVGAWVGEGFPLHVAVNVSSRQWRDERWLRAVRDTLTAGGLPPRAIVLEITESLLMEDAEATAEMLRGVRAMGARISIDDFGTGYSSLSYLRRFPVDILKIDRSFMADVGTEPGGNALVKAIVDMAHSLGTVVVAEGVETPAQLAFLREIGCDYGQGFHFTPPLPADAFLRYLAGHRR